MKFILNNICAIPSASITVDGITLIAGENNTGKSTIEKAISLYFGSMYSLNDFIQLDRVRTIGSSLRAAGNDLDIILKNLSGAHRRRHLSDIYQLQEQYAEKLNTEYSADDTGRRIISALIADYALKHAKYYGIDQTALSGSEDFANWMKRLQDDIHEDFNYSDDAVGRMNISNYVRSFFDGQIIRFGTSDHSFIEVTEETGGLSNKMSFVRQPKSARDICSDLKVQISVREPVLYIDSPNVFDGIANVDDDNSESVRAYLMYLLTPGVARRDNDPKKFWNVVDYRQNKMTAIQQEQSQEMLSEFYQMIDEVVRGHLQITSARRLQFVPDGGSRAVEMTNLSTGVKSLSVLAYAMEKGCITQDTVLVLDEPEINLHPAWQLRYAEILVRMQKSLRLKMIMTTHSPYFMEAIELYSRKYGIQDRCHYYLTSMRENQSIVEDVTNDLKPIYRKMAEPFKILEDIDNENE
jgi:predicted ATPase